MADVTSTNCLVINQTINEPSQLSLQCGGH